MGGSKNSHDNRNHSGSVVQIVICGGDESKVY